MARLGTWTTFDCPVISDNETKVTEVTSEALAWLREQFNPIDGRVRRVSNPHDFGYYLSFEIDTPEWLDGHSVDDCECEELPEKCDTCKAYDDFIGKANAIETAYSEKFSSYL